MRRISFSLFLVHCCHCFTWSLNKTISIFILIYKYSSVRKVSVCSIALRGEDTLKQTRPYGSHLNNVTAVISIWNYPSQAVMKTRVVLCFGRGLVQPTQLHSFWIQYNIIILIFVYSLFKKKVISFFFLRFWNIVA
jgi:hypothetical protein